VEDIPDIKTQASLSSMSKLVLAAQRVNGANTEDEVKNSVAVPTGG